jgi:hypothetical protein
MARRSSTAKPIEEVDINKGPSGLDLIESLFFDRDKVLQFDRTDGTQMLGRLVGMLPNMGMPQMSVLIVEYHPKRGQTAIAIMMYDTHNRDGWFVKPATVEELIKYTGRD